MVTVYLRFSPNCPNRSTKRVQSTGYSSLKTWMKSSTVNERCGILVIASSIFSSSKSVFLAISPFYTVGSAAAQLFQTKAPGLGPPPAIPSPHHTTLRVNRAASPVGCRERPCGKSDFSLANGTAPRFLFTQFEFKGTALYFQVTYCVFLPLFIYMPTFHTVWRIVMPLKINQGSSSRTQGKFRMNSNSMAGDRK